MSLADRLLPSMPGAYGNALGSASGKVEGMGVEAPPAEKAWQMGTHAVHMVLSGQAWGSPVDCAEAY